MQAEPGTLVKVVSPAVNSSNGSIAPREPASFAIKGIYEPASPDWKLIIVQKPWRYGKERLAIYTDGIVLVYADGWWAIVLFTEVLPKFRYDFSIRLSKLANETI